MLYDVAKTVKSMSFTRPIRTKSVRTLDFMLEVLSSSSTKLLEAYRTCENCESTELVREADVVGDFFEQLSWPLAWTRV